MMEVLQMINYIVWITLGVTIIIGLGWSMYYQRQMSNACKEIFEFNKEDEEA